MESGGSNKGELGMKELENLVTNCIRRERERWKDDKALLSQVAMGQRRFLKTKERIQKLS